MTETLELLATEEGDRVLLRSPDVGRFSEARPAGQALTAGQDAGVLLRLGRSARLLVPDGIAGTIVSPRPERVLQPVGHGTVLYELAPLATGPTSTAAQGSAPAASSGAGLVVVAPQSGRFYHRPAPDEPAFAEPGDPLQEGRPVGLIEVMKTFAHVAYHAGAGLPARARFVRYVVADGAEVESGEPLLQVEAFGSDT